MASRSSRSSTIPVRPSGAVPRAGLHARPARQAFASTKVLARVRSRHQGQRQRTGKAGSAAFAWERRQERTAHVVERGPQSPSQPLRRMLENFKPVAFEPYGRKRPSWRLPRWLVLLVLGVAAGVAGVMVVQERFLPPRLSASEASTLRERLVQAEQDRDRARGDLAATTQRLEAVVAERQALADELASDRERTKNSRANEEFLIASLPPDPRGGVIEVRAARLTNQRGALSYEVLLTRPKGGDAPLAAVMQFVVKGIAGGAERHVTLDPIKVSVAANQSLRGSVPLPDAFVPRQTTIQVLDRIGGKLLGMRVMLVS